MSAGHHHARVRKLTGLSLLANDKPWKVSYSVDTRYPGIMTVVGTSYHHTQPEALADAIEWTDGWAGNEHTMPDQVETRIENIRQYNQDILADENTRADDADKADDTLWLIDQLTATRQSIRDARTQEQEDQEVNRYLEANPARPYVWPPATPDNCPSLTANERAIANVVLSREGQRLTEVTLPGTATLPSVTYYEPEVAAILARYYKDQAER